MHSIVSTVSVWWLLSDGGLLTGIITLPTNQGFVQNSKEKRERKSPPTRRGLTLRESPPTRRGLTLREKESHKQNEEHFHQPVSMILSHRSLRQAAALLLLKPLPPAGVREFLLYKLTWPSVRPAPSPPGECLQEMAMHSQLGKGPPAWRCW